MPKHSRVPLMAGNWKMNLNHQEAVVLVQKLAWTLTDKRHDYAKAEVVVLPPFTDIRSVQTVVDGDRLSIRYGAQDVSTQESGAYTGEISAGMLAKLGCSYVVVGHSERREYHAETDQVVNAKAKAAIKAGMTPIVCVGEGLEIRQSGEHVAYTLAQLDGSLADLTAAQVGALVVAYEPVWAIGTHPVPQPRSRPLEELNDERRPRPVPSLPAGSPVRSDRAATPVSRLRGRRNTPAPPRPLAGRGEGRGPRPGPPAASRRAVASPMTAQRRVTSDW